MALEGGGSEAITRSTQPHQTGDEQERDQEYEPDKRPEGQTEALLPAESAVGAGSTLLFLFQSSKFARRARHA